MIVLLSLIVLLRELTIFAWCIPTSPFIQSNDFYTCTMPLVLTVMCCVTHVLVNLTEIRVSIYLLTDVDICMLLN